MAFPSAEDWLAERGLHVTEQSIADEQPKPVNGPVSDAVLFIRRSTSRNPQSSQRIREKLTARGFTQECVDEAIDVAIQSGDLDDDAFAGALVETWFERGHAPRRIAHDLKKRGFSSTQISKVLDRHSSRHDPSAAAFALAMTRATTLLAVPPDTALRRLTGHVARRGYSPAVASKAARDALYAAREQIQSAET
ncbi:MAG: regulatory protein RecX [Nitriliruptoraceae bacterium]